MILLGYLCVKVTYPDPLLIIFPNVWFKHKQKKGSTTEILYLESIYILGKFLNLNFVTV